MSRTKLSGLSAILLAWAGAGGFNLLSRNNYPSPDENKINPPLTEDQKQYYIHKAQEKRERRRLKRQK